MKYLPFEKLTLASELPAHEIRRRLALNVEPRQAFRFSIKCRKAEKVYEGDIDFNRFDVNRIIDYRNSFLPLITGQIFEKGNASEVKIVMRMATIAYIIWGTWMGGLSTMLFYVLYDYLFGVVTPDESHLFGIIIILAMLTFGYLLALLGFKTESKRSKKFFIRLLTPVPENASV